MIHLDTHVLVWVLAGEHTRLPTGVRQALEVEQLAISPTVELELTYLHEIERLTLTAEQMLAELRPTLELAVSTAPFAQVVTAAAALTWARDPFDRLIAGNAVHDRCRLLTADCRRGSCRRRTGPNSLHARRALITGDAGFIGSHLTDALPARGGRRHGPRRCASTLPPQSACN